MAQIRLFNLFIHCVIFSGGLTYGFGFAGFTTSIGQPSFYKYFKLDRHLHSILGAVNALFYAGCAFGSIVQAYLADWVGRKRALMIAAIAACIGAALGAGSVNVPMLVTCRLIHGFGLGMDIPLIPLFLTELASARHRGFLSGLTTLSFATGYVICGWIAVGTYFATNETFQWRFPLAIACLPPLIMVATIPFLPESPRYLAWVGKHDEAWKVISKIHYDPEDVGDASAARAEYTQIVRQVEYDKESSTSMLQIFKRPTWRRRAFLAMFILFASQSTGVFGIANYLPIIVGSMGETGVMPLVLYGVYTTTGTLMVLVVISVLDRVGRRTMFLIGFPGMALCLLAEAVLQWKYLGTTSSGGNAACILFIFVYIVFYQGVDAPSFVWAAEIFPTTIRAKGIALAFFSYFLGAITYTTPAPTALRNIGYRLYFIYMALCIISTVIVYFFVMETKGKPVEELGALFGDKVVVHLTSDGHGIVEEKLMAEVKEDKVEEVKIDVTTVI
ncbi:uncharacterized protein PV06_07249 [Exophiala oligosperma]|uniref:Major facilitator superfamily (MFS) profile domain-containing protein n=1 Tax=Exophiala oligosperma TaxID=215243 RepID=A0A0D2E1N6_9EURO|nr:uncharacterized protein PV06_07249 [Exophiala oligosperma]KIW41719.1 hypothetical protein PV06_07249 [Exophiala oligosperma]